MSMGMKYRNGPEVFIYRTKNLWREIRLLIQNLVVKSKEETNLETMSTSDKKVTVILSGSANRSVSGFYEDNKST